MSLWGLPLHAYHAGAGLPAADSVVLSNATKGGAEPQNITLPFLLVCVRPVFSMLLQCNNDSVYEEA